jgi:hypothetical protein
MDGAREYCEGLAALALPDAWRKSLGLYSLAERRAQTQHVCDHLKT